MHAVAAQQRAAQPRERLGQIGKRRPVAQRPGLALQQRDVVLPVVAGTALVGEPLKRRIASIPLR